MVTIKMENSKFKAFTELITRNPTSMVFFHRTQDELLRKESQHKVHNYGGWKFFSSPFNRFWSPKEENVDIFVKSSTPYQKTEINYSIDESMVVNYNEETVAKSTVGTTQIEIEENKLSCDEGNKSFANKYCLIM